MPVDDHEKSDDVHHSSVSSGQCVWCEICRKWHSDVESTARLQHYVEGLRSGWLWHTEAVPEPASCAQLGRSPASHGSKQIWYDTEICAMC